MLTLSGLSQTVLSRPQRQRKIAKTFTATGSTVSDMEKPNEKSLESLVSVIVPVRKGSQRVKSKNLRPFAQDAEGRQVSLLEWKLKQLTQVLPAQNIIVSSDWDLALELSYSFGVRSEKRPDRLAETDTPFEEFIGYTTSLVKTEHMAWAPVTSPFMGATEISECLMHYKSLSRNEQSKGLIAVSEERSYFFMGGSPLNFPVGKGHVATQDIMPLFLLNWAFVLRPTQGVRENSYMFSEEPMFFPISPVVNLDINYEKDFAVAQVLAEHYKRWSAVDH